MEAADTAGGATAGGRTCYHTSCKWLSIYVKINIQGFYHYLLSQTVVQTIRYCQIKKPFQSG